MPRLLGESVAVEASNGSISELEVGTEVCVYSDIRKDRPWIGVISEVLGAREFVVTWFKRKDRSKKFYIMQEADGRSVSSPVSYESFMFWAFADIVTESYLELSNYWIKKIANEYETLDKNF